MGITPLTFDGYAIQSVKLPLGFERPLLCAISGGAWCVEPVSTSTGTRRRPPKGLGEGRCLRSSARSAATTPWSGCRSSWTRRVPSAVGLGPGGCAHGDELGPEAEETLRVVQMRCVRTKGTIFSMPKPQGGRVWKPIFAEEGESLESIRDPLPHALRARPNLAGQIEHIDSRV